jgi:carbonic anhydrase
MKRIVDGLDKFQHEVYPKEKPLFEELATGQNPRALLITCADSRIDPGLLLQTHPGEVFVHRNAGNIVPAYSPHGNSESASVEFAVNGLKVRHIIVCGHSDCGAMKGLLNPEDLGELPLVRRWLEHSEAARQLVLRRAAGMEKAEKLRAIIEENVILQLEHLHTHPAVAAGVAEGQLDLYGWVYEIGTGEVRAYDMEHGEFVNLTPSAIPVATNRRRLAPAHVA